MIDEKRDKNARTWKTKKEEESHSIPDPDRASDRTINQFKIGIKARLMAPRKRLHFKSYLRPSQNNKDFLSTNEAQKSAAFSECSLGLGSSLNRLKMTFYAILLG